MSGRLPSAGTAHEPSSALPGVRRAVGRETTWPRTPQGDGQHATPHGHTAGWAAAEVGARSPRRPDPTAAAFFDVDNTMMQGASIYCFARGLAARKYFTTGDLVRFAWQQLRFRLLAGRARRRHVARPRRPRWRSSPGWRVDDMERLSEEIFDELMAERIWSGTHALAQLHLDAGQRVWLVTAAPVELGRVIAAAARADRRASARSPRSRDGVYTGRLVGDLMHGPAKAEAITALAAAEGLDLSRCAAYSDSVNDLPMLSAVGQRGRGQPRRRPAPRGPRSAAGRSGTSAPAARPPRSPCRRRCGAGCWPAPSPPGWRCTDAGQAH